MVKVQYRNGVSCDSCLKGNFRGRRYKCLVCYDYDLCASCYEGGASTTRHLTDHPMQCILTRTDFELYYGGEGVSVEQPQSLTCPYCAKMGFTEATLQEHVTADHPDTSFEVVCPVCASLPGGDPNHVTEDFAGHLTLEHRSGPRDLMSFLDESASTRHNVRRIPHPSRGVGGPRTRRSNMHFSSSGGLSPSNRESIDPIAELLSQLSGVRRTGSGQSSSAPSQLQQLQMQLQLERQQVRAARQQLERLPRRQTQVIGSVNSGGGSSTSHPTTMGTVLANNTVSNNNVTAGNNGVSFCASSSTLQNCSFLIPRCITTTLSDTQLHTIERESANRSLFARELVVSTLSQALLDLTKTKEQLNKENLSLRNSRDLSITSRSTKSTETISSNQEAILEQCTTASNENLRHSSILQTSRNNAKIEILNQDLSLNPSEVVSQNTAMVQALMHNVAPQAMVLQQPLSLPVRNTGTGTIREQISSPTAAYIRGGMNSVGGSRRKPIRTVDGRNHSADPPPPH
ncbi:E3 ubiquitin-protein ligase KCMF1-like isoform X2 [Belonocnema kinseyi]|uniref:E3 ubiquitin-protein ligase KCMF1-like isoform X2 n=1 Tax=Belonocnema kinseyi TaxID=2817044 RepID=UPI00143D8A3F|nr:E3 ubiquitin-protein ligase KCMF1-like isoform X2 [Belonocnema kinseyi]